MFFVLLFHSTIFHSQNIVQLLLLQSLKVDDLEDEELCDGQGKYLTKGFQLLKELYLFH